MSSKEIFIDPMNYDKEADAFQSTTSAIESGNVIDVAAIKKKTLLSSMDTLESIIEQYKQCVDEYVQLSTKDYQEMKRLKEEWVNADSTIANNTGFGSGSGGAF
ncbi:hypothetical protein [Alkalihalobacillus trypoxylicola]|uniref:Uncharacterized protein n=1 Tax=Alkalihalobacillus trypoxylicola TaxID=519424 RepID=A0A161PDI7_9BACI|nr:hypothetical protein [Alkalihalobacillus trypoxylicola]KYG26018.1 hypothetical protein AZF04_13100 [Alkalihalobacillus trypoxylicola]